MYKVIFLNELDFIQERNFTTEAAARTYASDLTGWYAILHLVSSTTVTDITTP